MTGWNNTGNAGTGATRTRLIGNGINGQSQNVDFAYMDFAASSAGIPTGPVNRPKSVGVVYAIYAGLPTEA
jgi:hypothetical protein